MVINGKPSHSWWGIILHGLLALRPVTKLCLLEQLQACEPSVEAEALRTLAEHAHSSKPLLASKWPRPWAWRGPYR